MEETQVQELDKPLDPRLVSTRKGGGDTSLKYIEGHDAIDQANRIFGYGKWAYRPLFCKQDVLIDPMTGEAVGIAYKAQVELLVHGALAPIVEVGSQPVAAWNVHDVALSRRKKDDKKREIEDWEKTNAMRTIVDAHEMAEKGAVTDALKRALRTYGNQFGNGLYGDGHVDLSTNAPKPMQPTSVPSHAQSEPLLDLIGKAKNRAKALGAAHNKEEWEAFLQEATGEPLKDQDITLALIARVNGKLTQIERDRKLVARAS